MKKIYYEIFGLGVVLANGPIMQFVSLIETQTFSLGWAHYQYPYVSLFWSSDLYEILIQMCNHFSSNHMMLFDIIQSSAIVARSNMTFYCSTLTTETDTGHKSEFVLTKVTPYFALCASYGVSVMIILEKIHRVITATYCIILCSYTISAMRSKTEVHYIRFPWDLTNSWQQSLLIGWLLLAYWSLVAKARINSRTHYTNAQEEMIVKISFCVLCMF